MKQYLDKVLNDFKAGTGRPFVMPTTFTQEELSKMATSRKYTVLREDVILRNGEVSSAYATISSLQVMDKVRPLEGDTKLKLCLEEGILYARVVYMETFEQYFEREYNDYREKIRLLLLEVQKHQASLEGLAETFKKMGL